jgi:flavodoxin
MKALITYYSYSGNTDKVVRVFERILRTKGEVEIQRLQPRDEIRSFVGQCRAAFTRKRAELDSGVKFDVSPYDLLVLGSPVWAFAPTPALNTFLDNVSGLNGKWVIILVTSGSGAGVNKCLGTIESVLKNKGAYKIDKINIKDMKVKNDAFVSAEITKLL